VNVVLEQDVRGFPVVDRGGGGVVRVDGAWIVGVGCLGHGVAGLGGHRHVHGPALDRARRYDHLDGGVGYGADLGVLVAEEHDHLAGVGAEARPLDGDHAATEVALLAGDVETGDRGTAPVG